jgi:hypothetical protein
MSSRLDYLWANVLRANIIITLKMTVGGDAHYLCSGGINIEGNCIGRQVSSVEMFSGKMSFGKFFSGKMYLRSSALQANVFRANVFRANVFPDKFHSGKLTCDSWALGAQDWTHRAQYREQWKELLRQALTANWLMCQISK